MTGMPAAAWIAISLALIAGFGEVCRRLLRNPRGDVETGVFWHLSRAYAVLVHHLRVAGREHVPPGRLVGPLIVVANHASGVDPVLVQAACEFEIRWLMSQDMRLPAAEAFWQWSGVIFVGEGTAGSAGTREALRHLKRGGVLGIFPEGGIERPARMIKPFLPGVGYIVKRSGAPVLPFVLTGVPEVEPAWNALRTPSHSRVAVQPRIDYARTGLDAEGIVADLRRRFMEWTGWPANDEGAPAEEPPKPMPFPRAETRLRRAGA